MSKIPPSVDNLPKQFVVAMRTLFDIMDDKRTGCVKLNDIEHRWRDDRIRGLPKGVIESLQTYASPNGLLTFDRFCAGLNLCLLRNQNENPNKKSDLNDNIEEEPVKIHKVHRPSSLPLLDDERESGVKSSGGYDTQRSGLSALAPPPRPDPLSADSILRYVVLENAPNATNVPKSLIYGPPKPPRIEKPIPGDGSMPQYPKKDQWFDREAGGEETEAGVLMSRGGRGPGDGKPAPPPPCDPAPAVPHKSARRREPRRHTLQNGIDYNVLKRMKQIEQEKDILVEGLSAIDKAREWYLKELAEVQEKMRHASRMGTHVEPWSEAQQERQQLQRARLLELNRQLGALAAGGRRGGLSVHMNLALPPTPHTPVAALQRQNHLLTEEVNKKSERISMPEREKSTLIRELLVLTNRNKNGENVF